MLEYRSDLFMSVNSKIVISTKYNIRFPVFILIFYLSEDICFNSTSHYIKAYMNLQGVFRNNASTSQSVRIAWVKCGSSLSSERTQDQFPSNSGCVSIFDFVKLISRRAIEQTIDNGTRYQTQQKLY